jgi:hypothetical protein
LGGALQVPLGLLEEEGLGPAELTGVEGVDGRLEQGGLTVLDLEVEIDRILALGQVGHEDPLGGIRRGGGAEARPLRRQQAVPRDGGGGGVVGSWGVFGQGDLDLVKKLPRPGRDLGGREFHTCCVDRLRVILETNRCSWLQVGR